MNFRLPYPPSLNSYWRKWNNRMVISEPGRQYRRDVVEQLADVKRLEGRLAVTVSLTMPDRRRRDIDNIAKCLLDSMQHAGVYKDDCQIDDLRIIRGEVKKPGWADVEINEIM